MIWYMRLWAVLYIFLISGVCFSQDISRPEPDSVTANFSGAPPQDYYIAGIRLLGAHAIDSTQLLMLSGLSVGDMIRVSGPDISQAIKKIWKQGIVSDVSISVEKISKKQIWLVVSIQELPRIYRVEWSGLKDAAENTLNDQLNLIKGKIISKADIKRISTFVKKYYADKGYFKVQVDVRQTEDQFLDGYVHLNIQVDRGKKVKVGEIHFMGNEQFTDQKLKKQLESTYGSSILKFFLPSRFIPADFEKDKQSLVAFYQRAGYRDAAITSDSIAFNPDKNKLEIWITVKEGEPYYFRNIEWEGNYVYADETLNQILDIEKGELFNPEKLHQNLRYNPDHADVSSLYLDHGYLFFTVDVAETGVVHDSVDIALRIYEGEQAKVGKVTLQGNRITKDQVVLRELRTLPGETFSREKLIRSQREIAQLGFFDPDQIGVTPIPDAEKSTVDLVYSVVENPNDRINLSGGWGGGLGFVGTLGFNINNFSIKDVLKPRRWKPFPVGDGQKFSVMFQANGKNFQSYSLVFSEPWLGGKNPNQLSTSISHAIRRKNFTNTTTADGVDETTQGTLQLSSATTTFARRLNWPDDYFTLSHALSYSLYELTDYNDELGFSTGTTNSFIFNTTLARNNLDHPVYPKQGSTVSLSGSFTPPYSLFNNKNYHGLEAEEQYKWAEYHKWMLDARKYIKIKGNLVLEGRAHLGYIGTYTNRKGVGPFERFYLGGNGFGGQSFLLGSDLIGLRGYDDNAIVPSDTDSNIDGGVAYNKFSLELRHPVLMKPAATLYLLGFAEAGNTWNKPSQFSFKNLYRSAGFGVRAFLPAFGLLGVDWGYGFDTLPGATKPSGWNFQFTIGTQIR